MHRSMSILFAVLLAFALSNTPSSTWADDATGLEAMPSSTLTATMPQAAEIQICKYFQDTAPVSNQVLAKNWCQIGGLATGDAAGCPPGYYRCYGTTSRCLPCNLEPRVHCK